MTLRALVERERRGVVRWIAAAGITAAICVAATLLALGTVLLANARWLQLPRITPWLVWLAVIALVALAMWYMRRRYARVATPLGVARAVERERALRDGSVRTALEVGEASSLGRLGAAIVAAKLEGFETPVLVQSASFVAARRVRRSRSRRPVDHRARGCRVAFERRMGCRGASRQSMERNAVRQARD